MIPTDLEAFRAVMQDERLWIAVGEVRGLDLAYDSSVLRVEVAIMPEDRTIVARMAWDDVGPGAGDYTFPEIGDWVLLAMADGDENQAFVIKRLSSSTDTIPEQAQSGGKAIVARDGMPVWITSNARINVSKAATEPTEPLVLGNVMKDCLTAILDAILNAPAIGQCAVGPVMLEPSIRAQLVAHKETYISNAATNILSQLSFTERGT